jgi:hypothetical protein
MSYGTTRVAHCLLCPARVQKPPTPTAQPRYAHPSSEHRPQKEHGEDDSSFTSNHVLHALHPESRLHLCYPEARAPDPNS